MCSDLSYPSDPIDANATLPERTGCARSLESKGTTCPHPAAFGAKNELFAPIGESLRS